VRNGPLWKMWEKILWIGEKVTSNDVGNGAEIQICQGHTYVGTKTGKGCNQNI
jgi:hypothetical protein